VQGRHTSTNQIRAIETVECSTALDLLNCMEDLVLSPPWGGRRRDRWAFRGQANSTWSLVPSAFREGTVLGFGGTQFDHVATGKDVQSYEQGQGEFTAVREFLTLADRAGLDVPGDSQLFRLNSEWENVVGQSAVGTSEWPPTVALETLAIAQHHGVPTRLLDFSYSSQVASWFPAHELCESEDTHGDTSHLVVWALDLDFIFLGAKHDREAPFVRVTVPRVHNPYLRAQQGLFLMPKSARTRGGTRFEAILEDLVDSYERVPRSPRWPGLEEGAKPGFKFRLPSCKAEELLDVLALRGVDEVHLRPSLDNVVVSLKRQRETSRIPASQSTGK